MAPVGGLVRISAGKTPGMYSCFGTDLNFGHPECVHGINSSQEGPPAARWPKLPLAHTDPPVLAPPSLSASTCAHLAFTSV